MWGESSRQSDDKRSNADVDLEETMYHLTKANSVHWHENALAKTIRTTF